MLDHSLLAPVLVPSRVMSGEIRDFVGVACQLVCDLCHAIGHHLGSVISVGNGLHVVLLDLLTGCWREDVAGH